MSVSKSSKNIQYSKCLCTKLPKLSACKVAENILMSCLNFICCHSTLDPNRVETACPRAVMHGGYYPRRGSIPFEIFMWSGGFVSGLMWGLVNPFENFRNLERISRLTFYMARWCAGLEIALWGLVTFPFNSCVSQLSVDQISRNFVYF